jgi:hypothetical protein
MNGQQQQYIPYHIFTITPAQPATPASNNPMYNQKPVCCIEKILEIEARKQGKKEGKRVGRG